MPPPEPGDSAVTRRRVVAKRPPTGDATETIVIGACAELFPLTGEDLSDNTPSIEQNKKNGLRGWIG